MAKKKPAKKKSAKPLKNAGHKSVEPKFNVELNSAGSVAPIPDQQISLAAESEQISPNSTAAFPVVGIGASAGGLEALDELLDHMPIDTGMAFVIVTHQHPGHKSLLPELLSKHTSMPVEEANDGVKIEPNHVYIGPPSVNLALQNGTLHFMDAGAPKGSRVQLPIDYFFRSLASDRRHQAICIVLSGTGTDGTTGLRAIKGESGMVMVQQPQTAKYAGMPSSAIATGLTDYVVPVAELPAQLVAYAKGAYLRGGAPTKAPTLPPEPLQKIFLLLQTRTGNNFSNYKYSTISRRIERRMNVHQIADATQYVHYLQDHPHEIDLLFKELLISVTNFFRDPEAFAALANGPIAALLKSQTPGNTIRGWVPGCATGEEVYSIAILLREGMEKIDKHFEVQIFGTDLDSDAIEVARLGLYPQGIGVDVSQSRLDNHFVREDSSYRIRKDIRDMAVFAPQNVIKDPPFTKLDFISCRNLLIYLNTELQKRLFPVFHYAIKPGGFLFLGPSESIGQFDNLFGTVDKKWKIYRRIDTASVVYPIPEIPDAKLSKKGVDLVEIPTGPSGAIEMRLSTLLERKLLSEFCPPCVIVNDRGDIIHVHGQTGEYLQLAEGQARTNVVDMARPGLRHELGSALRQTATGKQEIRRKSLHVKTNGGYSNIDLTVKRIENPETIRGLLMITFQSAANVLEPSEKIPNSKSMESDRLTVAALEHELQFMRESNQGALEEIETSNEELKSANEELQSTNEELQSTNEELETSKEEMHSLNEELTTVNAELQSKVDDLSRINDDMQNLLNSTDVATIFLDSDLNIKRYTEQSKSLIKIRETDIGRPITELASNLEYSNLIDDCRNVLKTLNNVEAEVHSTDGRWYLLKIMPYRTSEQVIDGVVITCVDISALIAGRDALKFSQSIINTVRDPFVILDENLRVVSTNQAFQNSFKTNEAQSVGEYLYELGGAQWDMNDLRKRLEKILAQDNSFDNFQVTTTFPKIGQRTYRLNARRLERSADMPVMILLAMEEVTQNAE